MTPVEMIALQQRIRDNAEFTAAERKLVLDCLALDNYRDQHVYPPNFGPEHPDPTIKLAWAVLDQLPPDAMKTNHRFQLAAMIAGALTEYRITGAKIG